MIITSHKHDPKFNSKLNGKEKFGFRKLSIGLVAVALDTSFFVGSGQLVHAADDTATETVVQQGNASDSSSADTSSSTTVEESTSSKSTTETAPAEKTNSESTTEGTAPPADEQKQATVTSRQTVSTETADKQATELAKASAATKSIPILGTAVTNYQVALYLKKFNGTVGGNISGTSDLTPLDKQENMIKDFVPKAKKAVGILYCSAEPNSKYQADEVAKYAKKDGLKVTKYTFSDTNDVNSVTQQAAGASDVISTSQLTTRLHPAPRPSTTWL